MWIRRIAIRNFRKLVGPLTLGPLGPGLNVVAGDNEEGKSTVLEALRAALFDKYNLSGDDAQSFQPYGSSVRPEVEVDLELDGRSYLLRKAFCQRPEAELRIGTERLEGPAVDERLREMLAFRPPGRGKAKVEHHGILGLLWVEQGTASAVLPHNEQSRAGIRATLEAQVGRVLGGERGRRLLDAVGEARARYWTDTGRPRKGSELEAARARVVTLEKELEDAKQALGKYDEEIDGLAREERRLAGYLRERVLERAEERLADAERDEARIAVLRAAVDDARRRLEVAEARRGLCAAYLEARRTRAKALESAASDAEAAAEAAAAARSALGPLEQRAAAANEALAVADARAREAERAHVAAEAVLERARLSAELRAREARHAQARDAAEQARASAAEAAAIALDDEAVDGLRRAEEAVREARARLDAAATRVELALAPGVAARIDGDVAAPDAARLVTRETTIELEPGGRVIVTPGGADLARRAADAEQAAARLARALERAGVANVADAHAASERRKQLLARVETLNKVAAAHAPEGLEELETEIAALRARLEAASDGGVAPVEERTSPAPGESLPVGAGPSLEEAARAVEAARRSRDGAAAARGEALEVQEATRRSHDEARALLAVRAGREEQARDQLERLRRDLAAERESESDASLEEALRAVHAEALAEVAALDAASRALEAGDPEAVKLQVGVARAAAANLREDIEASKRRVFELRARLSATGQEGVGERVERLAAELAQERREAGRVEREVGALRLLHEVLVEAERTAKETFLRPVTDRVQPYLRFLLPDAAIVVDADMQITGLRRDAGEERFEHLSLGTREQLAVLTRLAFADLLREQGRPAAVILDDALVNSDPERMERMRLVLRRAAERVQVIVLTCRESDYIGTGAPVLRLAECGASA